MNELIITGDQQYLTPVTNVHGALQRYQDMKDFVSGILKKEVDYGVIPGTSKNTLLKPGAEKLAAFFGLAITYEVLEKEMDWMGERHGGEPFFYFAYKVRLMRNGLVAGEGEGSCNSWEKKYRYRKGERKCPSCGYAAIIKGKSEYGGGWVCYKNKGGCGAKFKDGDKSIEGQSVEDVPNIDIADQVNTIQKMAQKRALVAATLNTVNASDWFTQDMEDFIDADFEPVAVPVPQAETKPEGKPLTMAEGNKMLGYEEGDIPDAPPEPERKLTYDLTTLDLQAALKTVDSEGKPFGEFDNKTLSYMATEYNKRLKLNGDDKAEAKYKLEAAKMIMKERANGSIK